MNGTQLTTDLTKAIAEALESAPHSPLCEYRQYFSPLAHTRGAKRWAALQAELKTTAPACTCWLGRLALAAGMEVPE